MSSEKALPKIITEDPGELNIGIDLDGVVANISSEVRKMVLEGLGIDASLAGNRKNSRGGLNLYLVCGITRNFMKRPNKFLGRLTQ